MFCAAVSIGKCELLSGPSLGPESSTENHALETIEKVTGTLGILDTDEWTLLGGCLFVVAQCQNTLPIQAWNFCCLQQSLCCPQNPTPFKQAVAGAQGQHQDCIVRQYYFTDIVNWLLLAALDVIWAAYESPPPGGCRPGEQQNPAFLGTHVSKANIFDSKQNEVKREGCVAVSLGSCALSSVTTLSDTLQKGLCASAGRPFSARCQTVLLLVL